MKTKKREQTTAEMVAIKRLLVKITTLSNLIET